MGPVLRSGDVWGVYMDDHFKQAVIDFFSSVELVDLLDIPSEDLVDLLEEYIIENEEQIKDVINYTDPSESLDSEDY